MKYFCLLLVSLFNWIPPGMAQNHDFMLDGMKWYIPQSIGKNGKVRGILRLTHGDAQYSNRFVDDPLFRDFAERAQVALGPGPSAAVAARAGRPELANLPVIRWACSQQGYRQWEAGAVKDPENCIAVLSFHGRTHAQNLEIWKKDGRFSAANPAFLMPTLHTAASRDGEPTPPEYARRTPVVVQAVADVRSLGGVWSTILEQGIGHCDHEEESMKLILLWLEDVIAQRVTGDIPNDGKVTLTPINQAAGWVGLFEPVTTEDPGGDARQDSAAKLNRYLNQSRFTKLAVFPFAEAPTKNSPGTVSIWLPSARVAQAWLQYHKTGNIAGKSGVIQTNWVWYQGLNDAHGNVTGVKIQEGANFSWFPTYFNIQNLPGFNQDYSQVRWQLVSGSLPAGTSLMPTGRILGKALAPGISRFTLRAIYQGFQSEQSYFWPLRNSGNLYDTTVPEVSITSPKATAKARKPLLLTVTSTKPIAEARWHSSLDGDLGYGMQLRKKLRRGQHLISVLVWNEGDLERDAASILVEVK